MDEIPLRRFREKLEIGDVLSFDSASSSESAIDKDSDLV
jgi:hypothetical protein